MCRADRSIGSWITDHVCILPLIGREGAQEEKGYEARTKWLQPRSRSQRKG